jgi:Jacalin-like lectin domain
MVRTFAASLALAVLAVPAAQAQQIRLELEDYGTISGDLDDCPLEVALLEVAELGGITVVFDPGDIRGLTVSAHLTGLTPRQTLAVLLSSQGLDHRELEGCLIVGPSSAEDRERLARRIEVMELEESIRELAREEDWDELPPDEEAIWETLSLAAPGAEGYLEPGAVAEFEVWIEAPGTYVFSTGESQFDTVLSLTDERGAVLAEDDDGGEGTTSRIELALGPGVYQLTLRGFGEGDGGSYTCRLTQPPQVVAGLSPGEEFACELGPDQRVWVELRVDVAGTYVLHTAGSNFDTMLAIYDSNQSLIDMNDDGGQDTTSRLELWLDQPTYLVELSGYGGAGGALVLGVESLDEPTGGLLTPWSEVFLPFSDGATIQVYVEEDGRYALSSAGSEQGLRLELYDADGVLVGATQGEAGAGAVLECALRGYETYFLGVRALPDQPPLDEPLLHLSIAFLGAEEAPIAQVRAELEPGRSLTDVLEPGETYWVSVFVSRRARVIFETTEAQFETSLMIYADYGELIEFSRGGGGAGGSRIELDLGEGQYLAQVFAADADGRGRFTLAVSTGHSGPRGAALSLGQVARGRLEADEQVHEVSVSEHGVYRLATSDIEFDTVLTLYDAEWAVLDENDDTPEGTESAITHTLTPGTYWAGVRAFSGAGGGAYTLGFESTELRLGELFGGSGGRRFSLAPSGRLARIELASNGWVHGMGCSWERSGGDWSGGWAGGWGESRDGLDLGPDEHVVGFSGRYGDVIHSLTIVTNQRTWTVGGPGGEVAFEYRAPQGYQVVGFYTHGGDALEGLGAILARAP